MKRSTDYFADISHFPMGSHQDMEYYRNWMKRYEGLKRHEKEINWKEAPGYDFEIMKCHNEIKMLVEADKAAEEIGLTIYGKWMKPSMKIAAKIKIGHPRVTHLFKTLEFLVNSDSTKRWSLFREAVDAFGKTTLRHWGTDAPIDLSSYLELEKAFNRMEGAINGGEGAPTALYNLREKYAAFVQDIADAEEADADIFYEDCDYEEKEELKEIIGNVECSNNDLDDFQNWLSGYHDGYNILTDYYIESPSRKFFYRIDPDGSAMFYTLLGLKWYHMWARDAGPVSLQDLLGQNHMMLECVLDKLGKLFPKAKQAYFKATKAIDKYTNFIHDLPETALKSEATSLNRQNKYDEILDHLREAAFIIKEQEESYIKTFIATNPDGEPGNRGRDIIDADTGVYHDLMSEAEYNEAVETAVREQSQTDVKAEERHNEIMRAQHEQTEILRHIASENASASILSMPTNSHRIADFYSMLLDKNLSTMSRLRSNLEAFNDDLTKEEIDLHIKYASGDTIEGLNPATEAMHFAWEHVRTYLLFKQLTLSLKENTPIPLSKVYDDVIHDGKRDAIFSRVTRNDPLSEMKRFERYKLLSSGNVTGLTFIFSDLYLVRSKNFRQALNDTNAGDFLKRMLNQFRDLFSELSEEIRKLTKGESVAIALEEKLNYLITKQRIFYFSKNIIDVKNNQTKEYIDARCSAQHLLTELGKILCRTDFAVIQTDNHNEKVMQKLETIEGYVRPKCVGTQEVVALIREVRMAKIPGVTSLSKAVDYIRHCQPEDERFYARAMATCQFVETVSKHEVGGVDKRWATLAQYAKGSDGACRRKAKSKGKPHPNITPQGW